MLTVQKATFQVLFMRKAVSFIAKLAETQFILHQIMYEELSKTCHMQGLWLLYNFAQWHTQFVMYLSEQCVSKSF